MRLKFTPLVAAAFMAAAPTLVLADARSSVRLTQFGYSLIDLNPADGIAPAVTFDLDNASAGLSARVSEQLADENGNPIFGAVQQSAEWHSSFQLFPNIERSVSVPSTEGRVRMEGDVASRDYNVLLDAQVRTAPGDGLFFNEFELTAHPATGVSVTMRITPQTELVWTGHLALEAQKMPHAPGTRWGWSSAQARMVLRDASMSELASFEDRVSSYGRPPGLYAQESDIRLSFANHSDHMAGGLIESHFLIVGQTPLIPEPGTPWLMLCGLGLVAGLLRRRRGSRSGGERALLPLAGAAALLAGPAHADMSARVNVTEFGYTLIDLNPGDGIAPGIRFGVRRGEGQSGSTSLSQFFYPDNRQGQDLLSDSTGMLHSLSTAVAAPRVSASATMGGSPARHAYGYSAQGRLSNSAAQTPTSQGLGFEAYASPADYPQGNGTSFRLTPFTGVVWWGRYSMRLESTVGRVGDFVEVGSVQLFGSIHDLDTNALDSFQYALQLLGPSPGVKTSGGILELSYANDSARTFTGFLQSTARVSGAVQHMPALTAPVPEPGTVGLMLCGVGAVAAAARRRSRA